MERNQVISHIG